MAYALLPLLLLSICHGSVHAASPASKPNAPPGTTLPKPLPTAAKEFLQAHNQARAAVRVGPLKWSEMLANAATRIVRYQRDNKGCQFADSSSQFGENQMWAGGQSWTPRMIVEDWVKEKNYYNYGNNSCEPNHKCGVYTQVVWNTSLELGCAQATCVKEKASLTVCLYNPPGNIIGERPY